MTADSDRQQKLAQRAGRPLDDKRNPQILRAALEVLAEVGYDRLTMDAVAERVQAGKATLYRRWSSKAQLVVDALAYIDPAAVCAKRANRGSLRADLCDLLAICFGQNDPVKQRVITGLASALCRHADLAEAWRTRFVEGQRCVLYAAYEQAIERGEIPPGLNLDMLTTVGPALLFYRLVMTDQVIDQEFIAHVVDEVLLPLCSEHLAELHQIASVHHIFAETSTTGNLKGPATQTQPHLAPTHPPQRKLKKDDGHSQTPDV